ncbi:exonuclease family protein [Escherichia albertii]|uniref:exodeoxyribonuclease VIII n=1 Tax=Escherichia albertii TaxID=208962 RepID=UPI0017D6C5D6|nr:exodeoxyribonuclease VIII [Escherichia albertii]MCI5275836.1 exodeoxyribonuclease VIII [Escherichia albertii]MCZ8661482.1 exodeoxyribonuclease VIII [Escherichia albertii]MCZ9009710.1 exodeoxyribonuclease VIII [Escherichia albertii]HCZ5333259.1 exodeoxyribonuclease VIII [Escherichia albertii]
MSELKVYIGAYIPDEKSIEENGARKVAYAFEARDEKHARAKLSFAFIEEYPGAQDAAFKSFLCEDAPGMPRPALNVWDEDFLYENDWSEELGHPVSRIEEPKPVDFNKLSSEQKIAVLVKYSTADITTDMLPDALELTQDEAGTFPGHIVEAISKTPAIAAMYPERIIEAIQYVVKKCATTSKWPDIKAQLANWQSGLNPERTEPESTEKLRTPSGATAGGGNATDRNPDVVHDFNSLALEIALGIHARAMDFDIYNLRSAHINRAREIIKYKEKPFPALFDAFRNTPGVLDYSRAMIIYAVKTAPENIESTPGKLSHYLNTTLTESDHEHPDPQMIAIACGTHTEESSQGEPAPQEDTPEPERQGPFYYRTPQGEVGRANKLAKLTAVIEQGCEEITREQYTELKNAPSYDDVSKQLAAQRGEYVEGISDPNDPKWVKTEVQPEVKNHGNGVFSIDGLMGKQAKPAAPVASGEGEKAEEARVVATPAPVDFQSVAASLEKDMANKNDEAQDNLAIWRSVMRTDPRFTKQMAGMGFEGTSINAEYMIMRATEIFGPIGSRWGFEILEDRMIPGAPFSEAVYEDKKFICNRMLRDGDGTLLHEQNHSIKIRLWYQVGADEGSVYAYGATPYMFKTKHGIKCDGEAQKKSLTDALKKALSLLGFSADVWLGLYDLPEYLAENNTEFAIKNASEKAEDITRLRAELDEKMTSVANTIETAVTPNEAKKVFDTLAREIEIHRKAAEAKGDAEHAKYLASRLRRLNTIKDARIKSLNEQQEQTA